MNRDEEFSANHNKFAIDTKHHLKALTRFPSSRKWQYTVVVNTYWMGNKMTGQSQNIYIQNLWKIYLFVLIRSLPYSVLVQHLELEFIVKWIIFVTNGTIKKSNRYIICLEGNTTIIFTAHENCDICHRRSIIFRFYTHRY